VTVIFPGALGDLLLALPALRVVRARHRRARITLVVSEWLRSLARVLGVADAVESLDAGPVAYLFGAGTRPFWLAGRPRVYTWLGAGDAVVATQLAAVASDFRAARIERGADGPHAVVAYARTVGSCAARRTLARTGGIRPPTSVLAEQLVPMGAAPTLAVHAGAGAAAKRWTPDGFAAVARWWEAQGGRVVEIIGPADGEGVVSAPAVRAARLPLPDLAAFLGRAAAYLGNDSGVSHLAGAVGASGVVTFGPTTARRWRPLGGRLATVEGRGGMLSLAALPVARVIATFRRVGVRPPLTTRGAETSVRP